MKNQIRRIVDNFYQILSFTWDKKDFNEKDLFVFAFIFTGIYSR